MDDGFSRDLNAWLNATSDRYVVDSTLKQSAAETTQVVYRKNELGEPSFGPFVRKIFAADTEQGVAYEQLLTAQAAGTRLNHVPFVYECEHTDGRLEVVMEYLQGQTLREYVDCEGCGVELAARVVPQLCDAIVELHESFATPLIHRDIKPSNIMVCANQVKLIDLGIARAYRSDAPRDTVRYGTPGYAPPEQFGYEQTNVRSDVYALGMTIAFCIIGEDPTAELRERAFADPRIPPALQLVLTKATQFDPNNRYGSARELKQAFGDALRAQAQQPAMDTPATPPPTTPAASAQPTAFVWQVSAPQDAPVTTQAVGPARAQAVGPASTQATAPQATQATTPPAAPAPAQAAAPAPQATPASAQAAAPQFVPVPAQTAAPAAPFEAQQMPPHAQASKSKDVPLRALGLVWDAILVLLWLLFVIAILGGSASVKNAPIVLGYMVGVFCVIVPGTCLVFPLLDKRLFRDKIPVIANLSKGQEVLACIAVGVISFVVCALVVIIWNVATHAIG